MGKEKRYHDEESTRIAKEHDKIKAENERKRAEREKARLEKYDKPFQTKKLHHEIQMDMHVLLTETRKDERDKTWFDKWEAMKKRALELGIYDSLVIKYQRLGIPK